MSHLRSMISLGGCGADGTNPTIPYVQIQSPEIRRHLDCVHPASEMATKTFTSYFYARHEPVSDQRFVVDWCKPVAARLAAWMNDIRNYILDEANAMLAPDLNPPLPRIKGVGVFPEDWNVKEIHESKEVLDLNELRSEYRFLMQFAVDHRGEDPLPQPKPKRRPPPPGPRGAARLMPRPLRPKPPRRKKPKDGGARAPRRRPSPGV